MFHQVFRAALSWVWNTTRFNLCPDVVSSKDQLTEFPSMGGSIFSPSIERRKPYDNISSSLNTVSCRNKPTTSSPQKFYSCTCVTMVSHILSVILLALLPLAFCQQNLLHPYPLEIPTAELEQEGVLRPAVIIASACKSTGYISTY